MLMKYEHGRPGGGRVVAGPAWRLAFRIAGGLRAWLSTRQDIGRLEQLDDHLLSDMGIRRDEIAISVRGRRSR